MQADPNLTMEILKPYFTNREIKPKVAIVKAIAMKEFYKGTRGHRFTLTGSVIKPIYGNFRDTVITGGWGIAPSFTKDKCYVLIAFSNNSYDKSIHYSLGELAEVQQGKEEEVFQYYTHLIHTLTDR